MFVPPTVGGRNPAPLDIVNIPSCTGFYTSQMVVWDFYTINSSIVYSNSNYPFHNKNVYIEFVIPLILIVKQLGQPTVDGHNPAPPRMMIIPLFIYRVLRIPGGAGFLPSTYQQKIPIATKAPSDHQWPVPRNASPMEAPWWPGNEIHSITPLTWIYHSNPTKYTKKSKHFLSNTRLLFIMLSRYYIINPPVFP